MTLSALSSQDSTLVFRSLLTSLSSPGEKVSLPTHLCETMPPRALPLLALTDIETTFCAPDDPELEAEVAELTGSRVVSVADANFVLCSTPPPHELVLHVGRGTPMQPELGCRLIVCTESHEGDLAMRLTGPGTRPNANLSVSASADEFIAARNIAVSHPPTGIDCWLVSANGVVVGLPRTTRVEKH